ncbi:serine hydrolase FSH [Chlamydoabsidia padenii]|nr:serine hydrolase FSH [Chlamydoabsidia padenii]
MTKLKILCLHGWAENGITFEKKAKRLMRSVEDKVDLVCPTAPYPNHPVDHSSDDIIEPVSTTEGQLSFSWLNPRRNEKSFIIKDSSSPEEEVWQLLKKVLMEQGPFDGVFGFSQGGTVAALLSILLEGQQVGPNPMGPDRIHPPLKFVILCGSRMTSTKTGYTSFFMQSTKIKTPASQIKNKSFHLIGELDTVVKKEDMLELADRYENPTVIHHPGGHFVPFINDVKQALPSFLLRFIA